MTRICGLGVLAFGLLAWEPLALAQPAPDERPIRAILSCRRRHVNVGQPIWVDFLIQNTSDEPVTLFVPGTEPQIASNPVGLPLAHVFSGPAFGALTIRNENNRVWNVANGYHPPARAPVVTIAGRATIGTAINARAYYPALRTPGDYRLKWSPYNGTIESNVLLIRVASLKQAQIVTEYGTMAVRFFYEEAPVHVDNVIELAAKGFYDNNSFHRIESGFFIQGGCPNGDGTGIRPDGVKLRAEISDLPQTRGMVSMALADDDPDSGSCQFFITNTRVPDWDGRYTIFGQLSGEESFRTLDTLMAVPTDASGAPTRKIYIRSVRVTPIPREQ